MCRERLVMSGPNGRCKLPPALTTTTLLVKGPVMAESSRTPKFSSSQSLVGQRFGRLLVASFAGSRNGKREWLCRCDCGQERIVRTQDLRTSNQRSCGCLAREKLVQRSTTHGAAHRNAETPEYRAWMSMMTRCFNPRRREWKDYGGRGITVCDRWRHDFSTFLSDVGLKPSPRHQLDRIDNDGHYEPRNVRWASPLEQARNQRGNVILEFNGERRCVAEWALLIGVSQYTLYNRIRAGWSVERILTTPRKSAGRVQN